MEESKLKLNATTPFFRPNLARKDFMLLNIAYDEKPFFWFIPKKLRLKFS